MSCFQTNPMRTSGWCFRTWRTTPKSSKTSAPMLPEKSVDLRPNRFWSRASCHPRLQGEQQDATTTGGIFGAIRSFQKKRFGSWFFKGFVDRFCSWCRRLRVPGTGAARHLELVGCGQRWRLNIGRVCSGQALHQDEVRGPRSSTNFASWVCLGPLN